MTRTIARPAPKRRSRQIVCGRMHCHGACKRWRHTCDFKVLEWSDKIKTQPRIFRAQCHTCYRIAERQREANRYACKRESKRIGPEASRASEIISGMSKADRWSSYLEGGTPITGGWSFATEDYDPTPVPQGCPSCYLRGGEICIKCPDPEVKLKVRAARQQGVICP